ncbi:MAG: SPOR domain-containing protein [Myxococcota bacterium]
MARPDARQSSWLTSLLGAVVLIAGGFLVGLVVGVVSEEPDLVVEHIAGGSEEVAWDARPPVPDVAAAPRADPSAPDAGEVMGSNADPEPVVPRGETAAAPPPARPLAPVAPQAAVPAQAPAPAAGTRVPARPPVAGFAVQVGAFGQSAPAERLAGELEGDGFPSYVTPGTGAGRWRVRVGPVATRDEAEALAGRLKGERDLPTWVLSEGGP